RQNMKIKRYVAPNMRSAIQMVRDEQGPDAVILSNRRVEGGVEVVAAIDYDANLVTKMAQEAAPTRPQPLSSSMRSTEVVKESAWPRQEQGRSGSASVSRLFAGNGAEQAAPERPRPSDSAEADDVDILTQLKQRSAPQQTLSSRPSPKPTKSSSGGSEQHWLQDPSLNAMREELHSLRNLVVNQLNGLAWGELKNRHPLYVPLMQNLLQLGLSSALSRELSEEVRFSESMSGNWRQAMQGLASRLQVTHDNIIDKGGVIALVGPSGVGKTTTAAKLAARYALRHGPDRVALVTIDNFRIGAFQQLRTFGRILGAPVHVAQDQQELEQILELLRDKELVIIDTAGVSHRDALASEQMEMLMTLGSGTTAEAVEIYALLSASSQLQTQQEIINAYSATRLSGVMLTKLDETTALGGSLSVAIQNRLPIAYLCDGQQVPEDIHPARSNKLVNQSVSYLQERSRDLPDEETVAMRMGGAM
ncbi:MAG: flagellar biosynthesis protein FlhF, partial [Gammaproteobacteria bacterium]|nr:flagellar biosynthesis protein FlhF [Gammaproteobacteria bacterium]